MTPLNANRFNRTNFVQNHSAQLLLYNHQSHCYAGNAFIIRERWGVFHYNRPRLSYFISPKIRLKFVWRLFLIMGPVLCIKKAVGLLQRNGRADFVELEHKQ